MATVRKWRARADTQDRSHRSRKLHATLSPEQELVVVELRKLLLPLNGLLVVTREFIHPEGLHSGLDRYGVPCLEDLISREKNPRVPARSSKDYAPGFVYVSLKYLPQMPGESGHQHLFAAIDREPLGARRNPAGRTADSASGFLQRLS